MSEYLTSDLQLSAYLKTRGYHPLRVDGPKNRRVFVFEGVPTEAIADYYHGTHPVAPQTLFTAYRAMKRLTFE